MTKLKQEVTYIENSTITGKKLIVGIKSCNSYILIKDEYRDSFYNLIKKSRGGNAPDEEALERKEEELIRVFHNHGYLEGDENTRSAFNEYNSLVKVFKKWDFSKSPIRELTNKKVFYVAYILLWIAGLFTLWQNRSYLQQSIQIGNFAVWEIIICCTIVPILIDISHELGHFIVAGLLGVKASNMTIGFFVTWPTMYIQYEGLNLYSTRDKLCVTSAGVGTHILNTLIGLGLGKLGFDSNILSIWCIANVGMISTNLMFFGPSDGYFILTNLIGIYNLRYRGYLTLNHIAKRRFQQTLQNYLCAAIVLGCWLWSFWGIYITLNYYGNIFMIHNSIIIALSVFLITVLFMRFVVNIKRIGTRRDNE